MGIGLIILGMLLSPLIIGIPIIIVGFLIGDYGVVLSIIRRVPGLEDKTKKIVQEIIHSFQPYYREKTKKE